MKNENSKSFDFSILTLKIKSSLFNDKKKEV